MTLRAAGEDVADGSDSSALRKPVILAQSETCPLINCLYHLGTRGDVLGAIAERESRAVRLGIGTFG